MLDRLDRSQHRASPSFVVCSDEHLAPSARVQPAVGGHVRCAIGTADPLRPKDAADDLCLPLTRNDCEPHACAHWNLIAHARSIGGEPAMQDRDLVPRRQCSAMTPETKKPVVKGHDGSAHE